MEVTGFISRSCAVALGMSVSVAAFSIDFNDSFLSKHGATVDLKYFEQGQQIAPGTYTVDIYLNQVLMKSQEVEFTADTDGSDLHALLNLGLLKSLGINIGRLKSEKLIATDSDDRSIIDLASSVSGASAEFDVSSLALQISVPQAYVDRQSRGYVDPSLWDDGITAFYTNYQTNFSRNISEGYRSDYHYIGLRNGFNVGAWRFRNESSITGSTGVRETFSSNRSYVERDIASIKGKMAAGELYTQGDIFDSVRFRGAQVSSELSMLSDNDNGYAPVVRGIAESNATVEVSQNNYVIYSTTVSPGAFEIMDIFPSGSNGDLKITVTEADGRKREYSQAYSYLPVMTRRGSVRYSFAAGQYQSPGTLQPTFTQGTLVYGMSDNLTGYGGALMAKQYKAVNLGLGVNSAWGGLSFDITQSASQQGSGRRDSGQSARFLYSKTINTTDTTFTMVGYRYSTEGYRTFNQHVEEQDYITGANYGRQKSRFDMTVNQSFTRRGTLFLSMGETNYWNRQGSTRRYQFGYSGNYRDTSYSFSIMRTDGQGMAQGADNQVTATVSIPFGSSNRSQRSYTSVTSSSQGDSSIQSGISGNANEAHTLSYSAQAGTSKQGGRSGSFGLSWDTPVAQVSGNYGQGEGSKHLDFGASGSVVVHGDGVTFGQSVGESFALVEVPGVEGVGVASSTSVRTNKKGYAVVPFTQPYRYNWINLDTNTLGADTQIDENSKLTVPTRGAIVKAKFTAESGRRVQFVLLQEDGQKIPFGARSYDEKGRVAGVVDNLSRLLVFGEKETGELNLRWGNSTCFVSYTLPPRTQDSTYDIFNATCKRG